MRTCMSLLLPSGSLSDLPQRRCSLASKGALHVAGGQAAHEGEPCHLDAGGSRLPLAVHRQPPLCALQQAW